MTDETKPFSFRLITINGIVIDFQSPNSFEAMWLLIKGEEYFQVVGSNGEAVKRIPFHAVASLEYITPEATMIYTRPVSAARN